MAMASEPKARDLKAAASAIFNAAIRAVDPQRCVTRFLRLEAGQLHAGQKHYDLQRIQRVYLIGVGKASAVMARSVEMLLGERIAQGLVITKYGHGVPLKRCRLMEAGHPLPDENGVKAADALLDLVAGAGPDDLILCMISGGGSALAPAPAWPISKQPPGCCWGVGPPSARSMPCANTSPGSKAGGCAGTPTAPISCP